jgi:hypothetical protein
MLLMLKVAILTKSSLSLYVWVRLSKGATEVRCSGRHYFTGGKKWKTTQGLVSGDRTHFAVSQWRS